MAQTPERKKEYMRGYMRERYRQQREDAGHPVKSKLDKIIEGAKDTKVVEKVEKTMDMKNAVKDGTELLKTAFKDEDTGKPEPFVQFIETVTPYLPYVAELAKGFFGNMQAKQQEMAQASNVPQQQAPQGWEGMTSMQRYNKKYNGMGEETDWYRSGLAYEQMKEAGAISPQINTNYSKGATPQNTRPPVRELSAESPQPVQQRPIPINTDNQFPLVKDNTPDATSIEVAQEVDKEKDKMEQEMTVIKNELTKDNEKILKQSTAFLNAMSMKDFKTQSDDLEALVTKWKPFLGLIPYQTREMIKFTPTKDFIELFKKDCKEKYEYLEKEKKLEQIEKLFDTLKKEL